MGLTLVTYISFNGGVGLSLPFVLQARLYTMLHSLCWQWNTDQLYIMQAIEAALQIHVWAHSSTCFAHSVCTKLCLKNGFTMFLLFDGHLWTAQVQTRYAWALSYSFHSQWISLIFAQNPCFGKGSKSKPQFYCKDMVNPMQWHHQPIATILWVL
jgi:hypothetical protein